MERYYVNVRTMEVVCEKDINKNKLAPELYYEYRCGVLENIIIEKWYCGDNKFIDFATSTGNPYKDKERATHFKMHGVSPLYLKAYTVPPTWFKEKTEEIMNSDR
jgi:hypothetical protein